MSEALKYKPAQEETNLSSADGTGKPKRERGHLRLVKDREKAKNILEEKKNKFAEDDAKRKETIRQELAKQDTKRQGLANKAIKARLENKFVNPKKKKSIEDEEAELNLENFVIAGQSQLRPSERALEPIEEEVTDFEDVKVKAKLIERRHKKEVKRASKRNKFTKTERTFFHSSATENKRNKNTVVEEGPDNFTDIEQLPPAEESHTDEKTAIARIDRINKKQELTDAEVKDKLEKMYAGEIDTDLLNEGYNAEERLRTAELNLVSSYRKLPDFQNTPDDELIAKKVGLMPIVAGEYVPFFMTKTKQICKEVRQSYKEYVKIRDDKKEREARDFLRNERAAMNNPERDKRKAEEAKLLRTTKR